MKTILFPTDFSKAANHAIDFAVLLAKTNNTGLTLFNVYDIFVTTEMYGSMPLATENLITETEKHAQEQINSLKESILNKYVYFQKNPSLLKTKLVYGFTCESIIQEAEAINPFCVVMGSKGANSSFDKFFGSVASLAMEKLKFPLFIIPEEAKLRAFQNIYYAADLQGDEAGQIEKIKEFASVLNADIRVLHITKSDETVSKEKMNKLRKYFSDESIVFRHLYRDNVIEGLEKYITNKKPDLLALVSIERGFLSKLFHHSVTRHLAMSSKIPLLILHEKPIKETKENHKSVETEQLVFP